jgi:hypothetical protein
MARSVVSVVLLLVGVVLLLFAAVDLLEGFGLVYCVFLVLVGVLFLALSRTF